MEKSSWEIEDEVRSNMERFKSWDDAKHPDDYSHYPYPTEHTRSLIKGELADRIAKAFGVSDRASVWITETKSYGGYSEWTQEHDFSFEVEITYDGGSRKKEFESTWDSNGLVQLMRWLDEEPT